MLEHKNGANVSKVSEKGRRSGACSQCFGEQVYVAPTSGETASQRLTFPCPETWHSFVSRGVFVVKKAIISPAVWGGLGSAAVTVPTSPLSSMMFLGISACGLRNEVREARSQKENPVVKPSSVRLTAFSRFLMSTGIVPISSGIAMIWGACEAMVRGPYFVAAAMYMVFAVGEFSFARIMTQGQSTRSRLSRSDGILQKIWRSIPTRIQQVVLDPGPWFSSGNFILNVASFQAGEFIGSGSKFAMAGLAISTLITCTALWKGLRPIFGLAPAVGHSCVLAAISDFITGTLSCFYGSVPVGVGTIMYGFANLLIAFRQRHARV